MFRAHFDRLKPYVARPGEKGRFDEEGRLVQLPTRTAPNFEEEDEEALPTSSSDFPVPLDDQQELQAWEQAHHHPGRPGGAIRFEPVSPPPQIPVEQGTEPSQPPPEVGPAPSPPTSHGERQPAPPEPVVEAEGGAAAAPREPLLQRITRRFRRLNPGAELIKALSPPKRRSRKK